MSSSTPLVSILLPVYNGEKTISKTIENLINQTYRNLEIIAVNDGSSDKTLELLDSYSKKEPRLKVFSRKNSGLIETLNFAIEQATGCYLVREDSDDYSNLERVEHQVLFMESNPDLTVCGSDYRTFGATTKIVVMSHDPDVCAAETLFFPPVSHPSTIIRKHFIDKTGLRYSEKYKHCEDYALWVDIIRCEGKINNINRVLHNYRNHENQVSVTNSPESTTNHYRLIKEQLADLGVDVKNDLLFHLHYADKNYLNKLNIEIFIDLLYLYDEIYAAYKKAHKSEESILKVIEALIEYKIRYALGLKGLIYLLTSGPKTFRRFPSSKILTYAFMRSAKTTIKKLLRVNASRA